MTSEDSSGRNTAVMRTLTILRCFTQADSSLSASEIARRTGIPQPTVWRYCRTLERERFLMSDSTGNLFSPGLNALTLGFSALARLSLGETANPYLVDLADRFSGVAGLAVLDGLSVRYVQRYQSPKAAMAYNIKAGWSLPIPKASAGWALLAALPPRQRDELINGLEREEPDLMALHGASMRREIDAFAGRGATIAVDVLHVGLTSVALPLPMEHANLRYALYLTGTTELFDAACIAETLLPQLRSTAQALGLALRSGLDLA